MKEQKQRRNEVGITLIALVVTIIILLILAGITISLVVSDGGLIDKSKEAIADYKSAQKKEQSELGEVTGMMKNLIDGLGSTGGTTPKPPEPPTPPSGGTGSSEVAGDLKEYQGKYVDIGLDVDGNGDTTNDWELFYATKDRIFLISADYVPSSKLENWGIIGTGGTLDSYGFKKYDNYNFYWPSYPTSFLTLPTEPNNFLDLVMHTQYSLETNKGNYNSMAASHLLNKASWNGIKTASGKSDCIDFVIGGPTIEMWCAAWNEAVKEDANGLVTIDPDPKTSSYGYNVKHGTTSNYYLYMNGKTSGFTSAQLQALGTTYKTFFPHTEGWNNCYGYWLASPSASSNYGLMYVGCDGYVSYSNVYNYNYGVRPVVSLASGVQIVETEEGSNKYNISK